jgi:hypothetical protein
MFNTLRDVLWKECSVEYLYQLQEVAHSQRQLYNNELHKLNAPSSTITVTKSKLRDE